MKRAIFAGCLAVMMLLSLGMALLQPVTSVDEPSGSREASVPAEPRPDPSAAADPEEPAAAFPAEPVSYDGTHAVTVLCGEAPVEMTLEDYLIGVVLAEMPASFAPAALEAQAVAARTFALRQSKASKHENADVCGSGACCQQYIAPEAARSKLGEYFSEYEEKVKAAVEHTDGLVITYQGAPIDAVYFSCSGGATETAAAVWGGDVPYLQSVESPGEEESSRYTDAVRVDAGAFRETILAQTPEADLSGEPAGWFGDVSYTDGGGVSALAIGGVPYRGTKLRSLFSLRSTWFTVSVEDGDVVFETRGYGHRVGMSQYGAQAMARDGADFREILTHYYTGVEIVPADGLS